ncbi:MAG: flagellar filament capping protein FliD, partial [Oscillospiraceae bacterium]|nr:flagellar filament capping protein FliD [Oscillospiraceae bacterium]
IQTSATLGSVAFKQALQTTDDGKYKFNINGVDFEFSKDTKISDVISTVNKSSAGVKLSFNNVSQTFSLETTQTGAAAEINLYQTEGNLLNSLFNLDSSQLSATNASIAKNVLDYNRNMPTGTLIYSSGQSKLANGFEAGDDDVTLKFTIDGEDVSIDLSSALPKKSDDTTYTDNEIASKLTEALKDACGAQGITLDEDFSIKYYTPGSDSNVKFLVVDTNAHAVQLAKTSGIGMADAIDTNTPVAANESTIFRGVNTLQFENEDGELVSITDMGDGISVQQLIDAGIVKMPSNGTMIAAGNFTTTDENTKKFLKDYFGIEADESGVSTLIGAKNSEVQTVRGSNSTLVISGDDGKSFTTYSSASNQFTFDGTTITLGSIDGFKAETDEDYITVETAKDTSGIKDVITSFVNDYNQLLEDLYKETSTTRPKSSGSYYDPLTEEQEEEMSDKEIEKWNENAKTGLLFRDSNVQKFLSEIRSAMVTRVNGFGLSDMGITLTSSWTENGKLEINESKLEAAIEAHGDEIAEFFTSENGLAAKLEKTVDKAISTKAKNYGYLSALAGVEGTTSAKNNQIYKQIEYIQDLIERLNTKYENEQERYWKKYTALESYMAQAQTQMSYFTDGSY